MYCTSAAGRLRARSLAAFEVIAECLFGPMLRAFPDCAGQLPFILCHVIHHGLPPAPVLCLHYALVVTRARQADARFSANSGFLGALGRTVIVVSSRHDHAKRPAVTKADIADRTDTGRPL